MRIQLPSNTFSVVLRSSSLQEPHIIRHRGGEHHISPEGQVLLMEVRGYFYATIRGHFLSSIHLFIFSRGDPTLYLTM